MTFSPGEYVTMLAALMAGAFLIWGEVLKRRTPSVEKEAEQEDQWRKELWDINRTLSADIAARDTQLKETNKLLAEVEKQNSLLSYQLDQLQHEKAAWVIEREEMRARIKSLEQDVFDQGRELVRLKRAQEQGQNTQASGGTSA